MIRLCGSVKFLLGFGIRHAGRWGGLQSVFTATLGLTLPCRLVLRLELGFGCSLRLRLKFGLGLADLVGTPLLVGDPIRHLLAGLVVAVQLVLFGIRGFGRTEPLADLGLPFPGPIL